MKYILYFVTAILLFSFRTDKLGSFKPPGTVKLSENLFVDETEITNISWMEYVAWQKKHFGKTSPEYIESLPDTNVWEGNNSPYVTFYFRHPAYRDYPVVGISYEQAIAFCEWRTERVKEYQSANKKNIVPKNFRYRLPTESEWAAVAQRGYSTKTQKQLNSKKFADAGLHNTRRVLGNESGTSGLLNQNADITAPIYSYWPNDLGVYNSIGNVSEMTSEKGLAKGGSWMDEEKNISIGSRYNYTEPTCYIGFRCVCEVIEQKYNEQNRFQN